jgi:hypothetical protein
MPQCPGGATFYVSFSDPSRKGDTHQWIDCSGERFDNPGGANYQVFYDHGEGLGPILIRNLTSRGGKFSVGSSKAAPVTIEGGLVEDNSLEIFGERCRVNGLTIRGNGAVDQFGSESVFENMVVAVAPKNGGPTGYGAGFLLRDQAKGNTIRFCTVLLEGDHAVQLAGNSPDTKVYGNVLLSRKDAIAGKVSTAGPNFSQGDPRLGPDHAPLAGSPLIGAARGVERPETDQAGRKRPDPPSFGAREPSR